MVSFEILIHAIVLKSCYHWAILTSFQLSINPRSIDFINMLNALLTQRLLFTAAQQNIKHREICKSYDSQILCLFLFHKLLLVISDFEKTSFTEFENRISSISSIQFE